VNTAAQDYDVIIVGAGIAGLTVAYRLRELNVLVLEADTHIGGRTLSEQFDSGWWANYSAQYLSPDKVKVFELADGLDVELVPITFPEAELRGQAGLSETELEDINAAIARLEAEAENPRESTAPELDDLTLAQYFAGEPAHVQSYFEHWCSSLMCASSAQTSVYGALLLWGHQRTTAFSTDPVEINNRGDCVFANGTNQLTLALARESGARICSSTRVSSIQSAGGRYRVTAQDAGGELSVGARQVICALPAPVAAQVCVELPDWKRDALMSVAYGRFLSTPILIAAETADVKGFEPTWCRPDQVYNSNNFALTTPGDIRRYGGCFHSYVYDKFARQIWDDPPHTVKTGAARALLKTFPEYHNRIAYIGYKQWRHGLPVYSPGRMKQQAALEASVDGLHFCGDYVIRSNTDGAVRSANAVADVAQSMAGTG